MQHRIFSSFVMAGYECSTQRRADGRRLDMLAATRHDQWAGEDYRQLATLGIRCARDGLRWHLIEQQPGCYDWSSFLPMLRAAQRHDVQVVWDLCHYGYPDDLDIWRPGFVERFARFAGAVARLMRDEGIDVPFYSPINEISFWSWAGGDVAYFNPGAQRRGMELKHQLVRASIAAIEAIRESAPNARFVQCDPLINVLSATRRAEDIQAAEAYRQSQFEALDLLTGRSWPGLGGREEYLDILGVNFYPHNQWFLHGNRIEPVPVGEVFQTWIVVGGRDHLNALDFSKRSYSRGCVWVGDTQESDDHWFDHALSSLVAGSVGSHQVLDRRVRLAERSGSQACQQNS